LPSRHSRPQSIRGGDGRTGPVAVGELRLDLLVGNTGELVVRQRELLVNRVGVGAISRPHGEEGVGEPEVICMAVSSAHSCAPTPETESTDAIHSWICSSRSSSSIAACTRSSWPPSAPTWSSGDVATRL
jgi:hypothetical protein